ncbi:hypothetical protein [Streptomyces sp. URMC 129]|uniref:hypothetical protein n=1 Tax=Streptomyces sp. URMC 129 TaxID=3423407 RepID=UPI003F1B9F7A
MAASVAVVLLPSAAFGHQPSPAPAPAAGFLSGTVDDQPGLSSEPRFASRPQAGEVLPVLPLGAGIACLGLGIGALGLRLRQS